MTITSVTSHAGCQMVLLECLLGQGVVRVQVLIIVPHFFHTLKVRVRVAVGDCLQVLAQHQGAAVLERCIEAVLLSINEHYVGIE